MRRLSARRLSSVVATAVAGAVVAGAPVARGQDPAKPSARVAIRGAGATFPAPLYEAWIKRFTGQHPDVALVYDAVGSGEGQRRFLAQTVDFGASDAALSDEQIASARSGASLVPVTAGMVVLAYNLPGLGGPLKLPRDVYVDMFAGRIRAWNDVRLVAANPGLALPARTIALVARQDASGTTFAMTNHLSAVSDAWRDRGPGVGNLVDWRGAVMLARGNEGVAARIKVSEGAIGYVEYHFARRLGLPMARLENRAGRFVEPTEASGQTALARNATKMPSNRRLFLPDPEGADAYPIVTFSWLLLQDRYPDTQRAAALKKFVGWCLTDGQGLSRELGYIPLPAEVASISLAAVDRIE
jgi:phosphate transport system substrate-binding protein